MTLAGNVAASRPARGAQRPAGTESKLAAERGAPRRARATVNAAAGDAALQQCAPLRRGGAALIVLGFLVRAKFDPAGASDSGWRRELHQASPPQAGPPGPSRPSKGVPHRIPIRQWQRHCRRKEGQIDHQDRDQVTRWSTTRLTLKGWGV